MNSQEKAKDFLELLKKREQLQSELTELNKQITQKSQELYDMMEDENVDSIEIEGIKFEPVVEQDFVLTGELAGKKWDDVTEWFQWLKEIGEDGLIRVKETVPWNTRKKFLKDWVNDGKPLPSFIKETFFPTVKYNKSAVKRLVNGE